MDGWFVYEGLSEDLRLPSHSHDSEGRIVTDANIFLWHAHHRIHNEGTPVMLHLPPLCQACRHYHSGTTLSCAAYPDGIPGDILSGNIRHVIPCSGDHGIQFGKLVTYPAYFMTADRPVECLFRVTCDGTYERYVPILDEWEVDNEFVSVLLETETDFRRVDEFDANTFIESAQLRKAAINPCSLQFRQMMYLHSRKRDI